MRIVYRVPAAVSQCGVFKPLSVGFGGLSSLWLPLLAKELSKLKFHTIKVSQYDAQAQAEPLTLTQ